MIECQSEKISVQSEKRLIQWVCCAGGWGKRVARMECLCTSAYGDEHEDLSPLTMHSWPVLLSGG